MLLHGLTHDFSKYFLSEFIPYAKYFYGQDKWLDNSRWHGDVRNHISYKYTKDGVKEAFSKAWKLHYKRNKHHWNYWNQNILQDMPIKYIRQMICDWNAMGKQFNNSSTEYYLKNYNKIKLTKESRLKVEKILELNHFINCCEYDTNPHVTLEEYVQNFIQYKKKYPKKYDDYCIVQLVKSLYNQYNIDLLDIFNISEENIFNIEKKRNDLFDKHYNG